jgi:hypothetical protein
VARDNGLSTSPNDNESSAATFTISVNGANSQPPVAVPDSTAVSKNGSVIVRPITNDTDPDGNSTLVPSSVLIVSPPSSGTAVVQSNGSILYTPANGFVGSATFSYTVDDTSFMRSNVALVTVNVVDTGYQNPRNRYDVNDDGLVNPFDVLVLINDLQRNGPRTLPPAGFTPPPYLDVDGNGGVSPIDVLQVINFLSRPIGSEGEGESAINSAVNMVVQTSPTPIDGSVDLFRKRKNEAQYKARKTDDVFAASIDELLD